MNDGGKPKKTIYNSSKISSKSSCSSSEAEPSEGEPISEIFNPKNINFGKAGNENFRSTLFTEPPEISMTLGCTKREFDINSTKIDYVRIRNIRLSRSNSKGRLIPHLSHDHSQEKFL